MRHILYVEDDPTLSLLVSESLTEKGYTVSHCNNGRAAWERFSQGTFSLCILDIMLPALDGFHLAQKIRAAHTEIPIIFLSAKSMKEDRIKGLKLGADDYLTKPFSMEELILKIEIFLRRSSPSFSSPSKQSLHIGSYTLETENLRLCLGTNHQKLTARETELLRLFILHKNSLLKREEILLKVWGDNDYFLGRSMDVFISRLRKYLKDDPNISLQNVHGIGFRLVEN